MIREIAEWLYESSVQRIVLLNGHIGTGAFVLSKRKYTLTLSDLQVRILDWWANHTNIIMASSTKDCPVIPSYVHANIGETSCILAAGRNFPTMKEAMNQDDYSKFFEYRMDQFPKFGVEERAITHAKAEFREQIFTMVEDAICNKYDSRLYYL